MKKFLDLIKKHFPSVTWTDAKHIDHGWDHNVIVLDDRYVFRFPRRKEYVALLKGEIELLKYLEPRITLKIPKYLFVAQDYSCVGYEKIPGKQMKSWIYRRRVKACDKALIAKQMGRFLTELHGTPIEIAKKYRGGEPALAEEIKDLRKNVVRYLKGKVAAAELKGMLQFLEQLYEMNMGTPEVLLHYDLAYEHILIDEKYHRLCGIIDFSDRSVGDPALDFAMIDRYGGYGEKFGKMVLRHYKGSGREGILKRAQMYLQRIYIRNMVDAVVGHEHRKDFAKEYREFKERFK